MPGAPSCFSAALLSSIAPLIFASRSRVPASVTLARIEKQRLLQPVASFVLAGAYFCLAVAIAILVAYAGNPRADVYGARALVILLGAVGVETLLTLLLEVYRPRVKGQQALANSYALEYPLNPAVSLKAGVKPLSELEPPDVDVTKLNGPKVIELLQKAGLL